MTNIYVTGKFIPNIVIKIHSCSNYIFNNNNSFIKHL